MRNRAFLTLLLLPLLLTAWKHRMRGRWIACFLVSSLAFSTIHGQQAPSLIADASRAIRDSRGGGGKAYTIVSAILKETRRIDIALPGSFSRTGPDRRYPVIVVLDGESNLAPTAAVSDELSDHGLMPEAIIVAIENTNRIRDLTPPGLSVSGSDRNQGGDKFLDFIEKELLPAVDRRLRGSAPRVIIGHSSGGILATYAAATRATYRGVIAVDAPVQLEQNWLAKRLAARAAVATPLRYVSYEAKFGWPEDAWNALLAAAPPSWILHREKLRLEGHETLVMLATYLGLREVFSDYSRLVAQLKPAPTRLAYYADVSVAFGATLIPPKALVRGVIDELLSEGLGASARDAYRMLTAGYGAPVDSATLLARIADVERRPAPTETVEGLLATPFPTPDEARVYIGEWKGDQWFKSNQPRTGQITLRIAVENGKVIAELINPDAPSEFRVRRVEYLRVTPTGLTYGFLNRMQPRGVILHEGTLKGDTLSGKSRFGGIDFKYPDGAEPDPGFLFVRAKK